jgi:uncharacterized membrane protein
MLCTLMASTSVLLCTVIASFVFNVEKVTEAISFVMVVGSPSHELLMLKLMLLIVLFMGAFFSYVQSMRYFHHVNYLINVSTLTNPMFVVEEGEGGGEGEGGVDSSNMKYARLVNPDFIGQILVRAMNYYTLGIRFYYFVFPALFWIFGPIPMLVVTILMMTILFFVLDASPSHLMEETSSIDSTIELRVIVDEPGRNASNIDDGFTTSNNNTTTPSIPIIEH